jgi:hypothetical protein
VPFRWANGVLCGQEIEVPHVIRIGLIIVSPTCGAPVHLPGPSILRLPAVPGRPPVRNGRAPLPFRRSCEVELYGSAFGHFVRPAGGGHD